MQIITAGFSRHLRSYRSRKRMLRDFYLVRLQTEGVCQAIINGTLHDIQPGDLLLCKPQDSYELIIQLEPESRHASADYYLSIHPNDDWIRDWWREFERVTKLNIGIDDMLLAIWKQLVHEGRRIRDSDPDILDYLSRCLLLHMKRLIAADSGTNIYELSLANRIRAFVEKHATEPFTLRDAAAAAGLSVSRASQLFKEAFGQPIMDYAIEVRFSIAKERILIGGVTLQEIAYQCGYANYTHFCRQFRSRYLISPSEYMRQIAAQRS